MRGLRVCTVPRPQSHARRCDSPCGQRPNPAWGDHGRAAHRGPSNGDCQVDKYDVYDPEPALANTTLAHQHGICQARVSCQIEAAAGVSPHSGWRSRSYCAVSGYKAGRWGCGTVTFIESGRRQEPAPLVCGIYHCEPSPATRFHGGNSQPAPLLIGFELHVPRWVRWLLAHAPVSTLAHAPLPKVHLQSSGPSP